MTTTVKIGDRAVHQLGFGAMRLSPDPGEVGPPHQQAVAILRRAVDAGIQLIDTADSYAYGRNEELVAEALHPYAADLLVTTKAGQSRPGGGWVPLGRPEYLKQQVDLSLMRLRVEAIELFQLHRIDPKVPFDEQIGALTELQQDGKIRHIGLSQVRVDHIERARHGVEVVSVQNKYSLGDRRDEAVLEFCEREGIAFLPWRPLDLGSAGSPTAQAAAEVADEVGATATQVALAWLLQRSPMLVPIPGTSSPDHLEQNLSARDLTLSEEQLARLDSGAVGAA
ncbi:aldo/keto reductase [Nocardioides speluncae]|uniref:aldo/keto reductase n=1 Tax=Nocardioides speluncae TaxID=2670337 RepID=UPI000D689568|nr:aldo/keto reductase [Nocardioides speluncae]